MGLCLKPSLRQTPHRRKRLVGAPGFRLLKACVMRLTTTGTRLITDNQAGKVVSDMAELNRSGLLLGTSFKGVVACPNLLCRNSSGFGILRITASTQAAIESNASMHRV